MNGITFNNKHSFNDFGLILNNKKIGTPSKKKNKESVVGMNSSYDFSTIASGGEITYNQRNIECKFTLISNSKAKLHADLSKIIEWLQDIGQNQLIFDDIADYYFLAEADDGIDIVESNKIAEITVRFIAEPFKTGVDYAANNLWNTFNFEEDYLQDAEYDVITNKTVTISNAGRVITPIINVNNTMSILLSGVTYNLSVGDNKIYGLKLSNGDNSITINGTGHIKFIFRKVVI